MAFMSGGSIAFFRKALDLIKYRCLLLLLYLLKLNL